MNDTPVDLRALHANYVEAISSIARMTPGGEVSDAGGLTLVRSGLDIPAFNLVFALDDPSSVVAAERAVSRTFGGSGFRWLLVTTERVATQLQPMIHAFGFHLEETMPGMVWAPLPRLLPTLPPRFTARPVRVPEEAAVFARTMMEGFEARAGLMDPWVDGVRAKHVTTSEMPGWYLGFLDDHPVCTAVRVTTGAIAGIYGVSTLPDFRRRGLGEAITRLAAADGYPEGARMSYLQSSRAGRSVYERIGYRWVEDYQLWSPAGSV